MVAVYTGRKEKFLFMKWRSFLLTLLLLTNFCWAEMTLNQLNSLFYEGKYEQLVVEGELLGKRFQSENNTAGVAKVYQLLTIAYMRLGKKKEMMRASALSKGAYAAENADSADPEVRERAILDKASALFFSQDMDATLSYVREQLKDWPTNSLGRFYLIKPKFHAIVEGRDMATALEDLEVEIASLEELLQTDPENRRIHLANLGRTHLLAAESVMYSEPEVSLLHGTKARTYLQESGDIGLGNLPGGPNLPYRVASAAGNYSLALKLFEEYQSEAQPTQPIYDFITNSRVAYWLEQLDRKEEAFQKYDKAIGVLDTAWSGLKLRENKASLMKGVLKDTNLISPRMAFERAIALALELGHTERAFELSELFKSRTLRDALSRQELEKLNPPGVAPALLGRERELFRKLSGKPTPELLRSYLGVLLEIKKADSAFYSLLTGNPGRLELPRLTSEEVLVEYFLTDSEVLLFLLEGGQISCFRRPLSREAINKQVSSLRRSITRVGSEKSLKKKLRVLSDALISPVEASLRGKKRVVFVPHGKLHYLPFASLLTDDGRYLIESMEVIVAPSAHSLTLSQGHNLRRQGIFQPDKARSSVFALGDLQVGAWSPLPGTRQESDKVKALLPQSTVHLGADMTRATVLETMTSTPILHFATHGYFNKNAPLQSGLVAADEDIKVADILQKRVRAYSVFLSACDTAVGKEAGADEIVGMQQSFQFAGTPSVIATLWQISDDATAELVTHYYDVLKTRSKGEALRQAQLSMLEGRFKHPYYWSAFVLSGDWI